MLSSSFCFTFVYSRKMNRFYSPPNSYKFLIITTVLFLSLMNVVLFPRHLIPWDMESPLGSSSLNMEAIDNTHIKIKHDVKLHSVGLTANLTSIRNDTFLIQSLTYMNPRIQQDGCVITVLLMDPNLNKAAFAALESVAENLHPLDKSCFLIQTSDCIMSENNPPEAYSRRIQEIYHSSRPRFQKLMEAGNVRVVLLNSTRYHQTSCKNFHPNDAWYNYNYWSDYGQVCDQCGGEFVPGQDSDFILTIQADTVLCHGLNVYAWQHFSFVGAPWRPIGWPCRILNSSWEEFHQNSNRTNLTIPPYISKDAVCTDPALGPVGNGGLSLRSRYWLRRAIQYCPRSNGRSGIDFDMFPPVCVPSLGPSEDIYFATILRGILFNNYTVRPLDHRPLQIPTMHEAALFASETISLSSIISRYNESYPVDMVDLVKKYWWNGAYSQDEQDFLTKWDMVTTRGEDGNSRYQRMIDSYNDLVPVGFHKIWLYQNIIDSWRSECKYLSDIHVR